MAVFLLNAVKCACTSEGEHVEKRYHAHSIEHAQEAQDLPVGSVVCAIINIINSRVLQLFRSNEP